MKPRRAEARRGFAHLFDDGGVADAAGGGRVIQLRELMMILELHRQGLSISAIAERTGYDRKTVRKYIQRGLVAPKYKARRPRPTVIDPFKEYLRERVLAWPGLTGARLLREIRELGYGGGKTRVNDFLRTVRPAAAPLFEVRLETPAGQQAQVDFAEFRARLPSNRSSSARSGCSPWCWATAATCGRSSSCIRTWPRCCAVTWRRSSTSAAPRARSCTTA
jgi:transposase